MRYFAAAATLAVVAAFGQQSDPGSGVLVPEAPKAFHNAMQGMVKHSLVPAAGAVPRLSGEPAPKTCAIPLLRVPVKEHLDDHSFLKGSDKPTESGIAVTPPAPPCR